MQPPEPVPPPAAYRPEFAEAARKLALTGAPDEVLARHCGIPLATLHEWLTSVPEFARAVHYGRNLADADVVDGVRQNAVGFVHEVVKRPAGAGKEPVTYIRRRPPNRLARNFWLMNRLPGEWCQEVQVEAEPRRDGARGLTRAELSCLMVECAAARSAAAGSTPGG